MGPPSSAYSEPAVLCPDCQFYPLFPIIPISAPGKQSRTEQNQTTETCLPPSGRPVMGWYPHGPLPPDPSKYFSLLPFLLFLLRSPTPFRLLSLPLFRDPYQSHRWLPCYQTHRPILSLHPLPRSPPPRAFDTLLLFETFYSLDFPWALLLFVFLYRGPSAISFEDFFKASWPLNVGVPQGSVFRTLLLFTSISWVIELYSLATIADPRNLNSERQLRIGNCLADIWVWLSKAHFKFNVVSNYTLDFPLKKAFLFPCLFQQMACPKS